jgi:putative N6-adenine-specific DNA methylase
MNYGFMHIMGYDEEVFFQARRNLKDQARKEIGFKIIASDISKDAITIAKKNAQTAGVAHLIEFITCDFADTPIPEQPGVIIFNPEYGERLGIHTQLEATYKRMGDFMKQQCKDYRGYIFTGNPDLAKKIGLRTSRRIEFYNGKLDCRLLEYQLYEGTKRGHKS